MTPTTSVSLSAMITTARKERGLSQKEVAEFLNLQRANYAKKESDEGFTEEQLKKLAKLFKLKYTDLLNAKKKKDFAKADAFIIIDDLQRHLVTHSLKSDAYLRTFSYYLCLLVAKEQKRKFEDVKAEFVAMVNSELELMTKQ